MQNLIMSWLVGHQQYFIGMAAGFVLSNPGTCATVAFNAFVRIPGVGSWIAANPDRARAWFDGFDKAIDDCITKYAASQAPPATAQKPPTAMQ